MEQTAKGPLEMDSRPPKPALKPKPLLVDLGAKVPGDGWQSAVHVQAARSPVPTKRRSSDAMPAVASGNVRKIREWFDKAPDSPEASAVVKRSLGVRRSVSAREALKGAAPVPKARRKPMVKSKAVVEVLTNHTEGRALALPPGALVRVPARRDLSSDRQSGAVQEGTDSPGGEESSWHCPTSCPCLCHMSRPGMALVWRPAPDAERGTDLSEVSLSDTSESDDKSFSEVQPISDLEEKREAANHRLGLCLPELSSENAGSESEDFVHHHTIQPAVASQDGERAVSQLDGNHQSSSAPESNALQHDQELPAKPMLKPPRRNKPVGQSSLDSAPEVAARDSSQNQRPSAAPSCIWERYTASDLDKFSKSVDQLNLRIQKLVLPDQRTHPSSGPEAMLKPPSPKVTRSAPPSPKEKYLQSAYIELNLGAGVNSGSNKGELHLAIPWSRSSKLETQNVIDWESRFESEPLYQTYREAVIHKEIKRQTLIRDSSKTSADYMYEIIPLVPDGERAGSSLWQNLPAVQHSGILDSLTQDERKQQESMFEVLTSEVSYLRSLNILIDHFMNSRDLNDAIILLDKKALFSCIVRVKEVSESFLKDLEERVDENIKITDVCDIIYSHAQHNFQVYVDYVRNQIYQEQKYRQLMETNAQFAAAIVRLQEHPQCQRLPLMSFLLLPFQRITRVKMLIENILQRSEVGSANEESALKALGVVSKIIEDCNREVGIMKQMEEMIHIAKKLEFDKLKAIPIISQLRHLEKQGELSEIILRGNLFGLKAKVNLLYFFLFNDLLLITTKKSGDRYQVVDYAHRSLVEVRECSDKSLQATIGNCFQMTLLENHQGKQCERLLKTLTESDRHRWMNALTSGKDGLQDDDKVYECWDCPQVQCLIPYTAQQADELSLEPADVINVIKKSPEGWFEGSKLSSGQKGWFPSDYVQEITNEHVRRRNLRERFRLLQAAQQLQQKPDGSQQKSTASL